MQEKVIKSDQEWMRTLDTETYRVARKKGTELPFTGALLHEKRRGKFFCSCCGQELFSSKHKYDSGSGWPSFFESANKEALVLKKDYSLGMQRVEVLCSCCDAHLGHVFNDGPRPTGLRYCINSVCLQFKEDSDI